MVESALRSVVRDALALTAKHGLPGGHHFYVTFRTDFPGVDIPGFLRTQYPHEMTIVLEHQFWGLEVDDGAFSVTLSFHNQAERLTIPLAAIAAFADPSVKFGLEFRSVDADAADAAGPKAVSPQAGPALAGDRQKSGPKVVGATGPQGAGPREIGPVSTESGDGETATTTDKPGEVVKLDAFRKK
jgi:hypothetical protein